jgi:hypothetical protein
MQSDDADMDRLIRALHRDGGEAASISEEVLHAYLTGRASASQKSEVRSALVRSPTLRQELIDLQTHLEMLATEPAAAAYDAAAAPPLKVLEVVGVPAAPKRAQEFGTWEKMRLGLQWLFTGPRLGPALAGAAVVVLAVGMAPRFSWLPVVGPSGETAIEAARFATPPGRSRGETSASHEEAALLALLHCLRQTATGIEASSAPSTAAAGSPTARIHLVDGWRRKLAVVDVPIGSEGSVADGIQIWIATWASDGTGDIALRSYPYTGATLAVRWAPGDGGRAAAVATSSAPDGHRASQCIFFDLRASR